MSTLITNTLQGINTIKYDASTTAMTIDSSGKVDAPVLGSLTRNVVSFCAIGPSSYTNYGASGVMSYNNTSSASCFDNSGGAYSTSNSEFTCAIAGLYHFEASALIQNEGAAGIILQYRDSSSNVIANFHGYNHGRLLHTHTLVQMTVGQKMRVLAEDTTPRYIGVYGRFTGYLIG